VLNTEGTRLDAGSSLVFSLGSEIISTGPVNLGGATLKLFSEGGRNESCGTVAAGTAYPIVSAQGHLRGVFANALPWSTVQVGCGLYRLRYVRWPWLGAPAGVSAVLVGYPTVTTLNAPVTTTTGTPVTLTSSTFFEGESGAQLTGTVRFEADGQTIPGCDAVRATPGGSFDDAGVATCTTAFTSTGSHTVSAVATPDASTDFLASSGTATVTVTPNG
jgi:hypothetical protein